MPSPDEVLAFEALARCGSFTAAAEALGCTKSMVSLRLKALEKQLGAVLVLRTTRRLALTEAGQRLLPHAEALRQSLLQMQPAVDSAQCAVEGPLVVSTYVSVSQLLAPILAELAREQPGLQLRLEVNNRVQDPIADVLDFCVRSRKVHDDSLVARPLGWVEEALYAAPGYLAAQGWPQTPEELAAHRLIMDGSCLTLCRGEELRSLTQPAPLLDCNLYQNNLTLTLLGHGIGALPDFLAAPALASGQLQRVLPGWHSDRWPVFLVHPYRLPLPRKYQVFLDFVLPRLRAVLQAADSGALPSPMH
ncbi:LysR family transcriptional regulator [Vogesella sp. LIG4]|uniref:LysR family transcriptional regulator n=1 Tax=Vogesella sp. LIG4 TaxID=1192162 RepID=UPI00081FB7E8|nr:LysR family transcriptional regulator [Vogesella sp. LIG4]SCK13490.1 DNA-binding transcriptional regulator, LysR family [Vogesella sp. LIG4]